MAFNGKTGNEHRIMLKKYFDIKLQVLSDNRTYSQLTKKEIQDLEKIYNTCTLAGVYANEMLNYSTGKNYPERNCITANTTGIAKANKIQMKIYPVPADNYFIVNLENGFSNANITLFNIIGEKVFEQKIATNGIIDCQSLPSGIYSYRITSDKNISSGSIQIVR